MDEQRRPLVDPAGAEGLWASPVRPDGRSSNRASTSASQATSSAAGPNLRPTTAPVPTRHAPSLDATYGAGDPPGGGSLSWLPGAASPIGEDAPSPSNQPRHSAHQQGRTSLQQRSQAGQEPPIPTIPEGPASPSSPSTASAGSQSPNGDWRSSSNRARAPHGQGQAGLPPMQPVAEGEKLELGQPAELGQQSLVGQRSLHAQQSGKGSVKERNGGIINYQPSGMRNHNAEVAVVGALALDNYIPFKSAEIRDMIIRDHPSIFKDKKNMELFVKFSQYLSLRNTMRLAIQFGDVYDVYSYIDPDGNTPDVIGGIKMAGTQKQGFMKDFQNDFKHVLDKGDFEVLPDKYLEAALAAQGADGFLGSGIQVEPADSTVLEYRLWYRTMIDKQVEYRSWRTGFVKKRIMLHVFERLVIMYWRRPDEEIARLQKERDQKEVFLGKLYKKVFGNGVKLGLAKLEPGLVYLKLFKEVSHTDIDLMMPGATGKFSWLDWIMIWGPIGVGLGLAIQKATKGTLQFDNMTDTLMSLALVGLPLTWGVKAYLMVKDKMAKLQAHLNKLYVTQNICSNAGVVAQVLGEAQEQEDNEAVLAYFFLWFGMQEPEPMSKPDLDKRVEAFLNEHMAEEAGEDAAPRELDFEVQDAIGKLTRMGIMTEIPSDIPDGPPMLKVLGLEAAVERAHCKNFNEEEEVEVWKEEGEVEGGQWYECVGENLKTGEKITYYWHSTTGQSVYEPPDEYVPVGATAVQPSRVEASKGSKSSRPGSFTRPGSQTKKQQAAAKEGQPVQQEAKKQGPQQGQQQAQQAAAASVPAAGVLPPVTAPAATPAKAADVQQQQQAQHEAEHHPLEPFLPSHGDTQQQQQKQQQQHSEVPPPEPFLPSRTSAQQQQQAQPHAASTSQGAHGTLPPIQQQHSEGGKVQEEQSVFMKLEQSIEDVAHKAADAAKMGAGAVVAGAAAVAVGVVDVAMPLTLTMVAGGN